MIVQFPNCSTCLFFFLCNRLLITAENIPPLQCCVSLFEVNTSSTPGLISAAHNLDKRILSCVMLDLETELHIVGFSVFFFGIDPLSELKSMYFGHF